MFELLLRVTVVLGVGLFAAWVFRRAPRRASTILRLTLVAVAVSALWSLLGPRLEIPVLPAEPVLRESVTISEAFPPEVVPAPIRWLEIAWALGAVLMTSTFLRSLFGLRRWVRSSRPADLEAQEMSHLGGQVRVRSVPGLPTLMTFGVIRPWVLVPDSFGTWSVQERAVALRHEAAHIRRFDCAWHWAALALRAVLWFHPLTWLLAWAHREQAELAADEEALATGVPASDYAEALVSIARLRVRGFVRSQGALTMSIHPLHRRVRALFRPQRGFSSLGVLAASFAAFSVAILTGAGQAVVPPSTTPDVLPRAEGRATPPPALAPTTRSVDSRALPATTVPPRASAVRAPQARVARPENRLSQLQRERAMLLERRKALQAERAQVAKEQAILRQISQLRAEVNRLEAQLQRSRAGARPPILRDVPLVGGRTKAAPRAGTLPPGAPATLDSVPALALPPSTARTTPAPAQPLVDTTARVVPPPAKTGGGN